MREKNIRIPLMVQVTMETTGTMLLGTEMAAAIAALEALPIDVLGADTALPARTCLVTPTRAPCISEQHAPALPQRAAQRRPARAA